MEENMKRRAVARKTQSTEPSSGLIITRFPKDLRRRIHIQALLDGKTMGDWMIAALRERVERIERQG